MTGKERCEVTVTSPNAPGVKGGVVMSRAVKVEIIYERQRVDQLELPKLNEDPWSIVIFWVVCNVAALALSMTVWHEIQRLFGL